MTVLSIDFESRSTADLRAVGLDNYAADPTTDVWCMAWALGDEGVNLWTPGSWEGAAAEVFKHVRAGGTVRAWNAQFELAIWNRVCVPRYGWPELKIEQLEDTMTFAYAMSFPGGLEQAAAALGLSERKDMEGHRLMMRMCRPRKLDPLTWWDQPEKIARLGEYCKADVRTERAAAQRLLGLSPAEREVWLLDQKINARGFAIDVEAAKAASELVSVELKALNKKMRELTGGEVAATTNAGQLRDWMARRGFATDSVDKASVAAALAAGGLPPDVEAALELRQEGAKASTAKLDSMLERRSPDGRIRNTKQYHGAGTGRWAGRGVQPDNFPRPDEDVDYDGVIELIKRHDVARVDMLYGPPLKVISESLRSMLCAPEGRVLFGGDYANIEGRGLAWAAGEQWKLDAFAAYDAGVGPDLYRVADSRAFHVPLSETKRQRGKVLELALGYEGGYGALLTMAKQHRVSVPPRPAEIWVEDGEGGHFRQPQHPWVKGWRDSHPAIRKWWSDLKTAARAAVENPGETFQAGPAGREVRYKVDGSFLFCRLQSGRVLTYPYPRVGEVKASWGAMITAVLVYGVNQTTRKWEEYALYGGLQAENIIQAICRDLLAAAMQRLEEAGYKVVMHVHDEAITERDCGTGSVEEFKGLMEIVPEWAAGWPISVGAWTSRRWKK